MFGSIKRLIKYISAIFFYYSGLPVFLSILKKIFARKNDFAILMYHRVLDENDNERDYIQPGLIVSRQIFEKQMTFLSKKYNLISLERLAEILRKNRTLPPKSMVITFDDGWKDNYQYAYPVLKKYNVPATIFLSTDFIDSKNNFWFTEIGMVLARQKITPKKLLGILKEVLGNDKSLPYFQYLNSRGPGSDLVDYDKFITKLKRLDPGIIAKIVKELQKESGISPERSNGERQTLNWEEIIEMNNNVIYFGSHGCSHRILLALTEKEIKKELIDSKSIIEQKLGREINLFSYPNGDYNDMIKDLTKSCGYICAVTAKGKKASGSANNLFSLNRINVHEGVTVGPAGRFSRAVFSFHIFRNT